MLINFQKSNAEPPIHTKNPKKHAFISREPVDSYTVQDLQKRNLL